MTARRLDKIPSKLIYRSCPNSILLYYIYSYEDIQLKGGGSSALFPRGWRGCPGGVYPLMSSGCGKAWPICKKIVTAPQIFPYLLIYIRIRLYLCSVFHGIRFKVSEDWLSRDNQFFVSCPTHISTKRFPPKISIYISPAVRQLKQAFLHECP